MRTLSIIVIYILFIDVITNASKIEVNLPSDYEKFKIPAEGTLKVAFYFEEVVLNYVDFKKQKLKVKFWTITLWEESRFNISGSKLVM